MSSDEKAAIVIRNVVKSFKIPLDGSTTLKQKIVNTIKGKKGYRKFTPLNKISITINKGEFFGIVGRNGSGKSTLLKIIAGIYSPNSGGVRVNGLLVPFIELGVGFNPELTGRENVYLNAALLGFSRRETSAMYDQIVEFAELQNFMGEQLKNYSSGMQVRLAFSIAIQARGDILLLDEVLAVGDSAFQQKCFNYFEKLKREGKTVVLVSHSMSTVERFCDRAALIDSGGVVYVGSAQEAANRYKMLFSKSNVKPAAVIGDESDMSIEVAVGPDIGGNTVEAQKDINISTRISSKVYSGKMDATYVIKNQKRLVVAAFNLSDVVDRDIILQPGKEIVHNLSIENRFTDDFYTIDVGVLEVDAAEKKNILYRVNDAAGFNVKGTVSHLDSLFHPRVKVVRK